MAELATLARPYAEAVFKRAKETSSASVWADALQFLAQVVAEPKLVQLMGNPKVAMDSKINLILDICQDQLQDEAKNLVKILVLNGKLQLLPTIAEQFEGYKAEDEGYANVELVSAYALSKAEQTKYVAMLEKFLNKKVNATVSVDNSLIGGILAKAGDKVIDGSIRGQLKQLAKRL